VVLMIPLLFEAGLQELCSEIWLVDCDEKQQLERLMQRDALSQEAAQQRIASQWSLEVKRKCADVIIDNRQHSHQLGAAVEKTLKRNKITTLTDPKIS